MSKKVIEKIERRIYNVVREFVESSLSKDYLWNHPVRDKELAQVLSLPEDTIFFMKIEDYGVGWLLAVYRERNNSYNAALYTPLFESIFTLKDIENINSFIVPKDVKLTIDTLQYYAIPLAAIREKMKRYIQMIND